MVYLYRMTQESPRSVLLSSNSTLFWRIFIPVFVTVFLAGPVLVFWLTPAEDLYTSSPIWIIRGGLLLIFVGWLLLARWKILPLKRVERDAEYVYVSNYWITVRYPWSDIERTEETRWLGRKAVALWLKAPGRFGKRILFLAGSGWTKPT